jgi:protein arginine kinase activator
MQCTFCPGHAATCHLTKLIDGKVIEVHVCERCIPQVNDPNLIDFDIWDEVSKLAKAKGMKDPLASIESPAILEISAKSLMISPQSTTGARCQSCGFTSEDLRKTGRLGCPECYQVFSSMLDEVINDCQKGTQHFGKIPMSQVGTRRKQLESMLETAVETERFEEAASLRDQIRSLDQLV